MSDLELLHFEQLKNEVQTHYLENHTPSFDDISKWKGIDIIYFQEDLRKKAKGNISEKSFYTYFKTSPVTKLPRIDMLNILSIYAGYVSWYDFKKNHLFAGELLQQEQDLIEEQNSISLSNEENLPVEEKTSIIKENDTQNDVKKADLQKSDTEIQTVNKKKENLSSANSEPVKEPKSFFRKNIWAFATSILILATGVLGFKDELFLKEYKYRFTDADRGTSVINTLEIKVIKENESPILYRIKPGEDFVYSTKDKILKMEIRAPFYEFLTVNRSLENAPEEETIELKPDDYKMAVNYFSVKDANGNPELLKQKRKQLESLISNNATIYQVYDNSTYGIETLDKQKYITLVTTPTTSLKNLKVIEMKKDKGKIVSIKFKIASTDENNN